MAAFCPSASAQTVYGLSTGGASFVTFNLATPGVTSAAIPFSNFSVGGGETITAIDVRPNGGALYGYSSANRLYTIGGSGALTLATAFPTVQVDPTVSPNGVGSDSPSVFPPTGVVSVDVNPNVPAGGIVGALRIVSTTGGNLRYAFSSNTLFRDDTLSYTGGGFSIVGAAYTNNDTDPATGTALYYLDATSNSLFTTSAPNDGVLTLVGSIGAFTLTSNVGFDIYTPSLGVNNAYAAFGNVLYSINLTTGAATASGAGAGAIGSSVSDIAVIPEPTTNLLLLLGGAGCLFAIRRRKSLS